MLARKTTLLPKFAKQTWPWARMLSYMFDNLKSKSFGSQDTNHFDVVFRKFDEHMKGCPFSSKLLNQWKEV